jgi:DtxR family Mn-dependent transcriptional regulator
MSEAVRKRAVNVEVTDAVEDYVKAIYSLQHGRDAPVSTSALAERLHVTAGSATGMVKKLARMELVRHVPYRGFVLTPLGRKLALEVLRHHRLLELYLAEAFDMPWDQVHAEAEALEHVLSEELEELIAAKLGNPTHDPHGDPIPDANLEWPENSG